MTDIGFLENAYKVSYDLEIYKRAFNCVCEKMHNLLVEHNYGTYESVDDLVRIEYLSAKRKLDAILKTSVSYKK